MENNFDLRYYQAVCQIQDDYIRGMITKEEFEQKLEIERLKQIIYLTEKVEKLKRNMEAERLVQQAISIVSNCEKIYRYKKQRKFTTGRFT